MSDDLARANFPSEPPTTTTATTTTAAAATGRPGEETTRNVVTF